MDKKIIEGKLYTSKFLKIYVNTISYYWFPSFILFFVTYYWFPIFVTVDYISFSLVYIFVCFFSTQILPIYL